MLSQTRRVGKSLLNVIYNKSNRRDRSDNNKRACKYHSPDYEMPLQVAAESGKEKWVNFLLAAGADPRLIVLPIKYHERMGMRGVSQEARQIINAAIATKLAELEEASRLTRAVSAVSTTSTGDNNTVTSTALSRSSSHSRGSNDGESSPSAKVDCSGIQNPLLASLRGAGQAYSAESTAERWE
jgi:hypothetical protein